VSRGIGKTQQRILDELAGSGRQTPLSVVELAERIGVSDRQVRRAVHALADRKLVLLDLQLGGRKGQGRYGPPMRLFSHRVDGRVGYDTVPAGMPVGLGLFVRLPHWRRRRRHV
jgi:predicted ArsR family transcriptional regulator